MDLQAQLAAALKSARAIADEYEGKALPEEKQKELNKIRCQTIEELGHALHPSVGKVFSQP